MAEKHLVKVLVRMEKSTRDDSVLRAGEVRKRSAVLKEALREFAETTPIGKQGETLHVVFTDMYANSWTYIRPSHPENFPYHEDTVPFVIETLAVVFQFNDKGSPEYTVEESHEVISRLMPMLTERKEFADVAGLGWKFLDVETDTPLRARDDQ